MSRSSIEDGLTTYQYDDSGQLLAVDRTGTAEDETYTYDPAGNRTSAGANDDYVVGLYNLLLSDGEYAYQYDAEGNRTVKLSLATDEREETAWDQRNRPVEIVFTDAGGNLTKRIVQRFDFFDHLIKRETYVRVGDGALEKRR